jgi:hypothetical protein
MLIELAIIGACAPQTSISQVIRCHQNQLSSLQGYEQVGLMLGNSDNKISS